MRRSERFLKAWKLKKTDHLPIFDFLFQQPPYKELTGVFTKDYNGFDAVNCAPALDHDGVWVPL